MRHLKDLIILHKIKGLVDLVIFGEQIMLQFLLTSINQIVKLSCEDRNAIKLAC